MSRMQFPYQRNFEYRGAQVSEKVDPSLWKEAKLTDADKVTFSYKEGMGTGAVIPQGNGDTEFDLELFKKTFKSGDTKAAKQMLKNAGIPYEYEETKSGLACIIFTYNGTEYEIAVQIDKNGGTQGGDGTDGTDGVDGSGDKKVPDNADEIIQTKMEPLRVLLSSNYPYGGQKADYIKWLMETVLPNKLKNEFVNSSYTDFAKYVEDEVAKACKSVTRQNEREDIEYMFYNSIHDLAYNINSYSERTKYNIIGGYVNNQEFLKRLLTLKDDFLSASKNLSSAAGTQDMITFINNYLADKVGTILEDMGITVKQSLPNDSDQVVRDTIESFKQKMRDKYKDKADCQGFLKYLDWILDKLTPELISSYKHGYNYQSSFTSFEQYVEKQLETFESSWMDDPSNMNLDYSFYARLYTQVSLINNHLAYYGLTEPLTDAQLNHLLDSLIGKTGELSDKVSNYNLTSAEDSILNPFIDKFVQEKIRESLLNDGIATRAPRPNNAKMVVMNKIKEFIDNMKRKYPNDGNFTSYLDWILNELADKLLDGYEKQNSYTNFDGYVQAALQEFEDCWMIENSNNNIEYTYYAQLYTYVQGLSSLTKDQKTAVLKQMLSKAADVEKAVRNDGSWLNASDKVFNEKMRNWIEAQVSEIVKGLVPPAETGADETGDVDETDDTGDDDPITDAKKQEIFEDELQKYVNKAKKDFAGSTYDFSAYISWVSGYLKNSIMAGGAGKKTESEFRSYIQTELDKVYSVLEDDNDYNTNLEASYYLLLYFAVKEYCDSNGKSAEEMIKLCDQLAAKKNECLKYISDRKQNKADNDTLYDTINEFIYSTGIISRPNNEESITDAKKQEIFEDELQKYVNKAKQDFAGKDYDFSAYISWVSGYLKNSIMAGGAGKKTEAEFRSYVQAELDKVYSILEDDADYNTNLEASYYLLLYFAVKGYCDSNGKSEEEMIKLCNQLAAKKSECLKYISDRKQNKADNDTLYKTINEFIYSTGIITAPPMGKAEKEGIYTKYVSTFVGQFGSDANLTSYLNWILPHLKDALVGEYTGNSESGFQAFLKGKFDAIVTNWNNKDTKLGDNIEHSYYKMVFTMVRKYAADYRLSKDEEKQLLESLFNLKNSYISTVNAIPNFAQSGDAVIKTSIEIFIKGKINELRPNDNSSYTKKELLKMGFDYAEICRYFKEDDGKYVLGQYIKINGKIPKTAAELLDLLRAENTGDDLKEAEGGFADVDDLECFLFYDSSFEEYFLSKLEHMNFDVSILDDNFGEYSNIFVDIRTDVLNKYRRIGDITNISKSAIVEECCKLFISRVTGALFDEDAKDETVLNYVEILDFILTDECKNAVYNILGLDESGFILRTGVTYETAVLAILNIINEDTSMTKQEVVLAILMVCGLSANRAPGRQTPSGDGGQSLDGITDPVMLMWIGLSQSLGIPFDPASLNTSSSGDNEPDWTTQDGFAQWMWDTLSDMFGEFPDTGNGDTGAGWTPDWSTQEAVFEYIREQMAALFGVDITASSTGDSGGDKSDGANPELGAIVDDFLNYYMAKLNADSSSLNNGTHSDPMFDAYIDSIIYGQYGTDIEPEVLDRLRDYYRGVYQDILDQSDSYGLGLGMYDIMYLESQYGFDFGFFMNSVGSAPGDFSDGDKSQIAQILFMYMMEALVPEQDRNSLVYGDFDGPWDYNNVLEALCQLLDMKNKFPDMNWVLDGPSFASWFQEEIQAILDKISATSGGSVAQQSNPYPPPPPGVSEDDDYEWQQWREACDEWDDIMAGTGNYTVHIPPRSYEYMWTEVYDSQGNLIGKRITAIKGYDGQWYTAPDDYFVYD